MSLATLQWQFPFDLAHEPQDAIRFDVSALAALQSYLVVLPEFFRVEPFLLDKIKALTYNPSKHVIFNEERTENMSTPAQGAPWRGQRSLPPKLAQSVFPAIQEGVGALFDRCDDAELIFSELKVLCRFPGETEDLLAQLRHTDLPPNGDTPLRFTGIVFLEPEDGLDTWEPDSARHVSHSSATFCMFATCYPYCLHATCYPCCLHELGCALPQVIVDDTKGQLPIQATTQEPILKSIDLVNLSAKTIREVFVCASAMLLPPLPPPPLFPFTLLIVTLVVQELYNEADGCYTVDKRLGELGENVRQIGSEEIKRVQLQDSKFKPLKCRCGDLILLPFDYLHRGSRVSLAGGPKFVLHFSFRIEGHAGEGGGSKGTARGGTWFFDYSSKRWQEEVVKDMLECALHACHLLLHFACNPAPLEVATLALSAICYPCAAYLLPLCDLLPANNLSLLPATSHPCMGYTHATCYPLATLRENREPGVSFNLFDHTRSAHATEVFEWLKLASRKLRKVGANPNTMNEWLAAVDNGTQDPAGARDCEPVLDLENAMKLFDDLGFRRQLMFKRAILRLALEFVHGIGSTIAEGLHLHSPTSYATGTRRHMEVVWDLCAFRQPLTECLRWYAHTPTHGLLPCYLCHCYPATCFTCMVCLTLSLLLCTAATVLQASCSRTCIW